MTEPLRLDELERRVLGVLVEKEATTPDQYPLSLNALTAGCNQKSNRDPVMELTEAEVLVTFEGLRRKGLAGVTHPAGGRIERYRHSARETLGVGGRPLAILIELCLRGPQTPGELRTRASRLREIESLAQVEEALAELAAKRYVERLAPAPGSRAPRWRQTLGGETTATPAPAPPPERAARAPGPAGSSAVGPDLAARVAALEAEVRRQGAQLARLAEALGEPLE